MYIRQKTAYAMLRSLVSSEVCIRDNTHTHPHTHTHAHAHAHAHAHTHP